MPPKRSLARTRQSKLNFSPASNASPRPVRPTFVVSSDSDNGPLPSRPAKRQRLERETERGMELGMPVSQNKRGMFDSSDNEILISSDSSSETSESYGEAHVAPPPKNPAKKAKKVVISDGEAEVPSTHKRGRAVRKASTSTEDTEGEVTVMRWKDKRRQKKTPDTSEEEEEVRPKRKKRGTARKASTPSDSESEGEATVTRRKSARTQPKHSADLGEGQISSLNKASRRAKQPAPVPAALPEDDDNDEVLASPKKISRRRKRPATESSEDEAPRTTRKGRRGKQRDYIPEGSDVEEQEDTNAEVEELREELAFLQSSPLGLGSTQNKAKSAREKALEAMKRRRAVTGDLPSSSAPRRKPVVVDSDSDSDSNADLEVIPEVLDEDSSEEQGSHESDEEEYGTTAQEALYGNDEDEEFINDDDAPIGVPAEHALPLQFSSLSNSKPRDLFKYAIDWMVQKKINPAFNSGDEIYEMSFRKLDDEVNGLAGSKYHSSVWTADFTRAIKARPEVVINDIDPRTRAVMEPHCEACNRRSHPATYELSFTGQPYHKETLEPLAANASDSDSDSDSSAVSSVGSEEALNGEKTTYDAQGERIPPESKVFTLGSTCKANAQVAHTLYHWRYHLNSWVVDYLSRQGHCTPEQLVRRDKFSQRKRLKIANKIVDEMESIGEIKKLYRMYKDQVNFALEAENDYRKGWGRRG